MTAIQSSTVSNRMKVASALRAPAKWGVRQCRNLTKSINETGVKKVATIAKRIIAAIAGVFAVVFGAIPYLIGTLLRGRVQTINVGHPVQVKVKPEQPQKATPVNPTKLATYQRIKARVEKMKAERQPLFKENWVVDDPAMIRNRRMNGWDAEYNREQNWA